ncbi:P-loop containing nucleoside triphosphate hydrolase protein [Mycena leptocephala]|nr:P-loop containing nucleoside triphosphate hydrolase protein [Mycena leptocephala]
MRAVKYFCYGGSLLARRFRIHMQELRGIRKLQHLQSTNVGERSFLGLARTLVKDSAVILDEATASVDLETDNKIQGMIQTQFKDLTLICIAHRLRTIISYDRILVLDAGKIAASQRREFDTPLNLFNRNESLSRSLCDKSNITSGDIEKAIISDDLE